MWMDPALSNVPPTRNANTPPLVPSHALAVSSPPLATVKFR